MSNFWGAYHYSVGVLLMTYSLKSKRYADFSDIPPLAERKPRQNRAYNQDEVLYIPSGNDGLCPYCIIAKAGFDAHLKA